MIGSAHEPAPLPPRLSRRRSCRRPPLLRRGDGLSWIDFDLYGHQIVAHLAPRTASPDAGANAVDGHDVPVPHFGVVLEMADWKVMAERLTAAGTRFDIEPHIRFPGEPGEQATMFFRDPSGNALEFKAFEDLGQLFAK
jgi:extradiol dioxygenase family protein